MPKSPRNKTLVLTDVDYDLKSRLVTQVDKTTDFTDKTINMTLQDVIPFLPKHSVDLLILDPPYNLSKEFHGYKFTKTSDKDYKAYLESWLVPLLETLKPDASVYLCGDWQNSAILYDTLKDHLVIRNRITWQREKGRGAKANWKNTHEDIYFATVGNQYYFDTESVKLKRKVIAPYRKDGVPKDWQETSNGNFRLTYPSNFWDDISIPYWSMPENTDHPTQKPEKLIAKLILASCPLGGLVLDPFLGSGTTSVVAKKLGRHYIGIEMNETYCLYAEKRLRQSQTDKRIQGYTDGVFWERNTAQLQKSLNEKGSS